MDLSDRQIIKQLRSEASELKECFTRFSFQAIALSAAMFGIIAKFQPETPYVGLSGIVIGLLTLSIARVGTYKYASANRHYGYELHLSRLHRIRIERKGINRSDDYYDTGWEEAMKAWRVVQATVFARIYQTKKGKPNLLLPYWSERVRNGVWFTPSSLVSSTSHYHPGSYLQTVNSILYSIACTALVPPALAAAQLYQMQSPVPASLTVGLTIYWLRWTMKTIRALKARVRILEDGLLCIHSCAIMWHATVVAHKSAMISAAHKRTSTGDVGMHGYLRELSGLAGQLAENTENIHKWIHDTEEVIDSQLA